MKKMEKEIIINLWKLGYSKKYICDLVYMKFRKSEKYKFEKANKIKYEAYHFVELVLLEEYRKYKND